MKFEKQYLVTLSLALGLPSSTLVLAIFSYNLVEKEIVNEYVAYGILFFYILGNLYLIFKYAKSKKN